MTEGTPGSVSRPLVVGIGASAGGVEALSDLLPELPATAGMAFLVVLHLDRTHASHLAEILAKRTSMAVIEATDGAPIEADKVYVITPDRTLDLEGSRLVVQQRPREPGPHMPVDHLFAAIARERGDAGIGIVLSGTGTDGSLGVTEIKAAGGITFAQDSGSAKFDGMPESAVESGGIDFVLAPSEIAAELVQIASAARAQDRRDGAVIAGDDEWKRLFRMLRAMSGVDFTHYKRSTIRRRLARRMALRRAETLERYLACLHDDPGELESLYQDLLIRVTSFFRDPASYEALAELVFPRLMQNRNPSDPLRIWVPGCATGEEVYSIAMVLLEYLGEAAEHTPIQIFGTDVNPRSIERARAGRYIENLLVEVPPERILRFFTQVDGHYEVNKIVRDLCIFAEHNVARDPPFSRLDIVSCRNLLIYFDITIQKRVIGLFHYALNPDRFLVLGPSESIGLMADMFELVDTKRRIYQRIGAARSIVHVRDTDSSLVRRPKAVPSASNELVDVDHLQREAEQVLLARYAPAGVLVDDRLNVLQFRGQTGRYLEHQQGAASLSLPKLVRPGVLVELSNAIEEARKSGLPVARKGVRTERGRAERIDVEVVPLTSRPDHARCFLILFEDHAEPVTQKPPARPGLLRRLFAPPPVPDAESPEARERDDLKREIEATRSYLQAIIEANEAAQEELRSANEEVLSANEEFQSTNEELETAKEELQSANEELATTNEELRHRNVELSQLNLNLRKARDHSQAIVDTIRQPVLLLDGELRVRRVNRAFCEMFAVARGDAENCLLSELGAGEWKRPELRDGLRQVVSAHLPLINCELRWSTPDGGLRTLRIEARNLREDPQHGDLVLLSIDDVTDRDRCNRTLREQGALLDCAQDPMIVHELNGPIRQWNRAAATAYGWTAAEALGKTADLLLKTRRPVSYQDVESALQRDGAWEGEQVHVARDGHEISAHVRLELLRHEDGSSVVLEVHRMP